MFVSETRLRNVIKKMLLEQRAVGYDAIGGRDLSGEELKEDTKYTVAQIEFESIPLPQVAAEAKKLHELKKEHADLAKTDPTELDNICISNCSFLFERYTDIYNRVFKEELDLKILDKFLDALKDIEDGNADQHEASVKVGTYLKELYVDSALKKTEKNDLKAAEENDTKVVEPREVSWAEYKAKMVKPLTVRIVRKS